MTKKKSTTQSFRSVNAAGSQTNEELFNAKPANEELFDFLEPGFYLRILPPYSPSDDEPNFIIEVKYPEKKPAATARETTLYSLNLQLITALHDPNYRYEATDKIRGLIDKITFTPKPNGGLTVNLHGDLAEILTIAAGKKDSETEELIQQVRSIVPFSAQFSAIPGENIGLVGWGTRIRT